MKTKILADFQICISVPLMENFIFLCSVSSLFLSESASAFEIHVKILWKINYRGIRVTVRFALSVRPQQTNACSKSTTETLAKGVKHVQS